MTREVDSRKTTLYDSIKKIQVDLHVILILISITSRCSFLFSLENQTSFTLYRSLIMGQLYLAYPYSRFQSFYE